MRVEDPHVTAGIELEEVMGIVGQNLTHPIGHHGQCPIPGDGLEAARSLRATAQHWSEQSIGIAPLPRRVLHLGAQVAPGKGVIRIAPDAFY
ncbi:hypothetical protein LM599_05985 [Candidatus Acetothermia bacterium]|nr:hypothetical protein [Candidatus Acetothermia bacterium]